MSQWIWYVIHQIRCLSPVNSWCFKGMWNLPGIHLQFLIYQNQEEILSASCCSSLCSGTWQFISISIIAWTKIFLLVLKLLSSLKWCYRNKLCDPWNDPLYSFTRPCSFSLLLVWFKTLARGSLAQGQTSGRLALAPMHHGSAVPLVLQMCFHWN